jgi:DNA-binding response OmpR family regulator
MRPKKRILLACDREDRLSQLRYLLTVHGYAVTGAETITAAWGELNAGWFDLVLVDWPLDNCHYLLNHAHEREVASLVLAAKEKEHPGCMADAVLLGRFSAVELLERVKIVTARKRGPKPMKKPVASVPAIDVLPQAVNL